MNTAQPVGGTIYFKVDGDMYMAKGNFTYNLGKTKRSAVVGADGVHGYKAEHQVPFIEGEITDESDLDLAGFLDLTGVTATLELANGKVIVLREAWNASDGTGNSDEGNISIRFEGMSCEEVTS